MEKLRSVNTKFWNDPFIETLDNKEKLLFLYLLTNPLANILGIYEISLSRISFDTGLTIDTVEKALKGFERNLKVYYLDGFIILANFQKNQNMNSNMEKGAIELFKKLPNKVKTLVIDKALKGFERLSNGFKDFEKYESESEIESEDENKNETEIKKDIPDLDYGKLNKDTWVLWIEFKKTQFKFTYKSLASEQVAINELIELSENNDSKANEIINQSIANGWKGLFQLKPNGKTENKEHKKGTYADWYL